MHSLSPTERILVFTLPLILLALILGLIAYANP
jgi:hypothetical protein